MKIENYISQLLCDYQCVTIPGFGAFLTETQSAQLSESTNTFYPPKKSAFFNPHLKNNDGLLANHISKTETISYEEAVTIINEEVILWKKVLQNKEVLSIKDVGILKLNTENSLVFEASQQPNYLTNSFGLTSFVSPTIKREICKKQITVLEKKSPITFTLNSKRSHSYLRYTAVFVVTLGVTSIGLKLRNTHIENETLIVKKEVQREIENKIQQATFFIDNPLPAVTLAVKEAKMPYHIVAGSFREEYNAEKVYQQLIKLGFKAQKIEKNKHELYTVLYGSFSTYTEAQKTLNQIRSNRDSEAWLLIDDL